MISNLIQFKKYEGREQKVLASVKELAADGSIDLIPSNFRNHSVRVQVLFLRKDGTSTGINCSLELSKELRAAFAEGASKKQLLAMVWGLNITEQTAADGTPIAIISRTGVAVGNDGFTADDAKTIKAFVPEDALVW